jgi:hypothetical protein
MAVPGKFRECFYHCPYFRSCVRLAKLVVVLALAASMRRAAQGESHGPCARQKTQSGSVQLGRDCAAVTNRAATVGQKTEQKAAATRAPSRFASPYVPMDSWVYAAFDRLTALGYAPSAFANLRPWTRMECARIIVAAGEDLGVDAQGADDKIGSEAHRLHAALAAEFATDLDRFQGSGGSEIRMDSIYTRYTEIAGTPLDDSYQFG